MPEGTTATKAPKSTFEKLLAKNVGAHVEKKGKFSYLSWAYAVADLCSECPSTTWEVLRFPLPDSPHLLVPYCQTPTGYFVEVAVTVDGVRRSQVHPVLDERNNVIKQPNAFDINRATQRALVKAIGLHGLGLNLYAGEDLPLGEDEGRPAPRSQPQSKPAPKQDAPSTALDDLAKAINAELDAKAYVGSERKRVVIQFSAPEGPQSFAGLSRALEKLRDQKG